MLYQCCYLLYKIIPLHLKDWHNCIDIDNNSSDIIEKINKLYEYSKNAIDCTSINFRNPESIIEEN